MASRRQFIKTVSSSSAAVLATSTVAVMQNAVAQRPVEMMNGSAYSGPREMVKNSKILAMLNADGTETLGVVTPKGVIDVRAVAKKMKITAPYTLDQLLQEGNAQGFYKVIASADKSGVAYLKESNITFGRLFQNPGKIVCVGLNYRAHADELGMTHPRVPPLFNKYNNSLAAHNCLVKIPPPEVSYKLDYETELLIVIGKKMRNVPESDALSYVAGYCTSNDFSSRDLQLELPSSQWMIGKTLDQYAPIGPYFVSADLVGDPNALKVQTWVNGVMRQNSNTSDFIHNTQKMLSYISTYWSLEPGDIVFTGTPQGVIAGMPKDKQVWLKKGDQIVSSVEKLGELKFTLG